MYKLPRGTVIAATAAALLVSAAPPVGAHIPSGATTSARVVERFPDPPPTVVTSRAGRHATFDRFVVELRGKATGYRIRYVDTPRYDGSGRRIPIYGRAYLSVVLTPANAHTSDGSNTYAGPRLRTNVGYPTIKAMAFAGDFEANVSFALALRKKARFHVGELTNPRRLYIDVAH